MSKKNKILIAIVAALFAGSACAYAAVGYYYTSHFYSDTKINQIDCTGMTVDEVIARINENLDSYRLAVVERGDATEYITGSDIDISFTDDGTIAQMMEAQNASRWVSDFFKNKSHEITIDIDISEEKLQQKVDALACMQEANITAPKDAYVTEGENGYIVAAEEQGNQPIRDTVQQVIKDAVLASQEKVNLDESDCYAKPAILQSDATLQAEADDINKVIKANLSIGFGDSGTEVLDGSTLKKWVIYDSAGTPVIDQGQIKEYVRGLAQKYDTVGKDRAFTTSTGQSITATGGDYGWAIDVDTTTQELIDAVNEGQQGDFEVTYSSTAKARGADDIGNSYLELSIQDQTTWLYVDGKLILSTPVVTGTVSLGRDTPTGIYKVKGKATDYTMKGDKNEDGEWSYLAHCNYWIPFAANGTIGFHDLASRTEYGGTIYLTAGSHGCVNTPLDMVSQIYDAVAYNFPVVVY